MEWVVGGEVPAGQARSDVRRGCVGVAGRQGVRCDWSCTDP